MTPKIQQVDPLKSLLGETQLAWINAWSQRMKEQITSAEQPEPQGKE